MSEAWKLLDLEYGDVQEIRAKLKDQVRSIKLKATGDSAKLVELFHAIQTIAAKIKASGSISLLKADEEYIALVTRHLPKEIAWKWCRKDLSGWSSFYSYLEKEAKAAKKMMTNKSINSDKSQNCSLCHKSHSGKCQRTKTTAVIQGNDKICPVCNKQAHKYKTKSGTEGFSKQIKD